MATAPLQIEKLDGSNYHSWKYNMKMVLIERDLWDYVNEPPVAPTDPAELAKYKTKLNKALALVSLFIATEQQVHIRETETPKDAWLILQNIYEPKSRPRVMQLMKQFSSLKMDEDEQMIHYLNNVKRIADCLKEAGKPIDEEDIAFAILNGLPSSYESLVMYMSQLAEKDFTVDKIRGMLLTEFDRRKAKEVGHETEVLVTQKPRVKMKHQKKRYEQVAPSADKSENKKHGTPQPQRNEKGKITCYRCGGKGH